MAERIFGTVKADREMGTGLKEGTKVQALGTIDGGENVVVRVLSNKLTAGEQMVVTVPKERFVYNSPKDSKTPLKPYERKT